MTKDKGITIRINEELLNEFNAITDEKSINKSNLIRAWIKDFVNENKGKN